MWGQDPAWGQDAAGGAGFGLEQVWAQLCLAQVV